MSHLRLLPGGPEGAPITNAEFLSAVTSEDTSSQTAAVFRELLKSQSYTLPELEAPLGSPRVTDEYGCVFKMQFGDANNIATSLLVHEAFPLFLTQNRVLGLRRSEAIETAAVYVRAYDVVERALQTRLRRREGSRLNFLTSLNSALWEPQYVAGIRSTAYRAAGLLALTRAGAEPLDLPDSAYPPHIAGMINPLPRGSQVRGGQGFIHLGDALRDHSKNSS